MLLPYHILHYFDISKTALSNMIVNRRAAVLLLALTIIAGTSSAFTTTTAPRVAARRAAVWPRSMAAEESEAEQPEINLEDIKFESEEQKKQVVGNLVADDEWDGLTMELTDLVRKSCT